MARKKFNKLHKIIGIILLIVIIIGVPWLIFSKEETSIKTFAIGSQCNVFGSGTISASTFVCDSAECDVEAFATCTTSTGTAPSVSARFAKDQSWIALNCIPSGAKCSKSATLQGYCVTSTSSSGVGTQSETITTTPEGKRVFAYNSKIYVGNLLYSQSACGITEPILNTQPVSGYEGREDFSGSTSQYQCRNDYTIYTAGGSTKKTGSLTYSGTSSGQYTSGVITIQQKEKIDIPGFQGQIKYALKDSQNSCFVSKCNSLGTAIIPCVVDSQGCGFLSKTETACATGEVCIQGGSGATCQSTIKTLIAQFEDQEGNIKEGYAINEPIYFKYHLNSETAKSATVSIELTDTSGNLIDKKLESITFPNTRPSVISFSGQKDVGTYKIVLKITYDGGKTISPQTYQTRIANQISIEIIGSSEGVVKTIYTNKPAIIELRIFDEAGKSTSATTSITALLVEGNKKTGLTPTNKEEQEGIYKYYYNIPPINVDSILQIEAKATKLGFSTTKNKDLFVKPATIEIELPNIANLIDLAPGTTSTIQIETTNPQGDLIDIDSMIIRATSPGGTISQPITANKKETGKYEISYTFGNDPGAYFFEITANKQNYLTKTITTPAVNIVSGGSTQELECTTSNQCGIGEICVNNECIAQTGGGTTITYTVWIVLGALALIIIILGIVLFRRRKQQTPSSFTGL